MPTPSFIEAQTAALCRYGVDADEHFVDVPTVNGIGTPAAMWAPLMARLDGYTLYAVDLPAYGLTDTTTDLTRNFGSTAVQFLDEVLDGLELNRASFVANSLGSLWAIWLATDRPGRVAALVHVGCPAIVLDTSAPLPMRLLSTRPLGRSMMKLQPPSARQVKQLSKMVNEHPLPPEIADLILATEQLPDFETTFLATLHKLVRLRGARPDMALTRDQLAQVTQPSLLVFGQDDPMGAASVGEQLAAALPHAELHIVDGGHAPWVHHAEQIGPIVSAFLSRTPAESPAVTGDRTQRPPALKRLPTQPMGHDDTSLRCATHARTRRDSHCMCERRTRAHFREPGRSHQLGLDDTNRSGRTRRLIRRIDSDPQAPGCRRSVGSSR